MTCPQVETGRDNLNSCFWIFIPTAKTKKNNTTLEENYAGQKHRTLLYPADNTTLSKLEVFA
jgi:hypothetical protein